MLPSLLVLSDLAFELVLDLVLGDLPAVIQTYGISFGEEARDKFGRIRPELFEVEILDRVDVRIIGLLARVNDLIINKLLIDAGEVLVLIICLGLAVGIGPLVPVGELYVIRRRRLGIVGPEREINAAEVVGLAGFLCCSRREKLSLDPTLKQLGRLLLRYLERNDSAGGHGILHIVNRHDLCGSAVRTAGSRVCRVENSSCAAALAGK